MTGRLAALTRALRAPGPRASVRRGVTLVELMIAMALIGVGIIAMVQSFGFIQKAIQAAKNRTLASNLAQEKMQILKQKNYYQVLVTSDPAHNTVDFAPESIDYDTGYFPPEQITEAGVTYTRYTYVQVAREDSGNLVLLSPSTPDTGMRLITITVVWSQGGVKKKLSVRSILSNPDTVMSNSVFIGSVTDQSNNPIQGAIVNVAENMGWRDTTNAQGRYSINVLMGNYNMVASADGYYTMTRSVSITANATQTQNFTMVKIATGSISGAVWLRDHLVISQVVASTTMVNGDNVEYVELFNPTTAPINISNGLGGNSVKLKYLGEAGASQDINEFPLTYVSTYVPAGRFFLIANTATMTAAGYTPAVDAVYSYNPGPCNASGALLSCVHSDKAGALVLTDPSGKVLDKLGWSNTGNSKPAPDYEGAGYPLSSGLPPGKQLVRMSQPCSLSANYGRAYDSGHNNTDFFYMDITYQPYAVASGVKAVYSGTPAVGAVVTATDGVSSSTAAWLTSSACGYSTFTLVDVATGTWSVLVSSGMYGFEDDNAYVPSAGSVYQLSATTTSLTQNLTTGLITGRILSAYGTPITPGITVSAGSAGSPTTADTVTGRYTLRVSTGLVNVTANPASACNGSYVTLSSESVAVELGQVTSDIDFVLYQGGKISGFVTRDGVNALPGVAVVMLDSNGVSRDQEVTGLDGRFTSITLSTGTYSVAPAVGSREMATPDYSTVTLTTAGVTKFSSTFTVSGAMGYITGAVSSGGSPIKTGVLIVVTTSTLTGTPPAPPSLSTATLAGAPYYIVSSMENGTYRAEVTQSTSTKYNVYAYFPSPSGASSTVVYKSVGNVSVTAGQTTSGVDFSW